MPVDPSAWIEANLDGVRRRGVSYEADCPFCGKSGHLYVHGEDGHFTCFKCGAGGRDMVRLVAEVEGVTVAEARRRMFRDTVEFKRSRPAEVAQVGGRLRALLGREPEPPIDTAPPASMVPVWDGARWRMPTYLSERGLTRRLARRYGLGFCGPSLCATAPSSCRFPEDTRDCVEQGRCRYANRIVLPYSCPNGRSFTTRAADGETEPKYLNPPAPKGRLLYGWQAAHEGGELVLVEGPFDALRLASHGIASVAVMGLSLGGPQLNLLSQLRLASVTLMLDAGVETEAIGMASDLVGSVREVYVARLPDGADPGDSTREQAWAAFREAERFKAGRGSLAASIGRKLGGLRSEFTSDRARDRLVGPRRGG